MTHSEPDRSIDLEDSIFFEEHAAYSGFLASMNTEDLNTPLVDRVCLHPKDTVSIDEAEALPRQKLSWAEKNDCSKLPIRDINGAVCIPRAFDNPSKAVSDDASAKKYEIHIPNGDLCVRSPESEIKKGFKSIKKAPISIEHRSESTGSVKTNMAVLCESILEDPQASLKKEKDSDQSKLQDLVDMCSYKDDSIQKLAMISVTTVLLDILPDYRIRIPDEKQLSQTQKQKVIQVQSHEALLLSIYQDFLKFLESTILCNTEESHIGQSKSNVKELKGLSIALSAVKCLAQILKAKFNFNFSLNLISAVVPLANSRLECIRETAATALEHVFKIDSSGIASLAIVKQISSYARKNYERIDRRFLECITALPLKVSMEAGELARKKAKNDRRKRRKLNSGGDTISTGLKEAEATVDKNEKAKTQAEILHEIVLVYFRILKNGKRSPALPAILSGLAKFSMLIHYDVVVDLLSVLKGLIKEENLSLPASLSAIFTGVKILEGPGRALAVDEKEFVTILYQLLLRFTSEFKHQECFSMALLCVESLFIRRKEIIVDRVAAFVKRLLLVSSYLSPQNILASLSLCRSLFHKYPKLHQLLDNDSDRVTTGCYNANVDDPDFSNPYASACWELSLLKFHWHPKVSSYAEGTAKLLPVLPNESPLIMMKDYSVSEIGFFLPTLVAPKPNQLHRKLALKKGSRKIFVKAANERNRFLKKLVDVENKVESDFLD